MGVATTKTTDEAPPPMSPVLRGGFVLIPIFPPPPPSLGIGGSKSSPRDEQIELLMEKNAIRVVSRPATIVGRTEFIRSHLLSCPVRNDSPQTTRCACHRCHFVSDAARYFSKSMIKFVTLEKRAEGAAVAKVWARGTNAPMVRLNGRLLIGGEVGRGESGSASSWKGGMALTLGDVLSFHVGAVAKQNSFGDVEECNLNDGRKTLSFSVAVRRVTSDYNPRVAVLESRPVSPQKRLPTVAANRDDGPGSVMVGRKGCESLHVRPALSSEARAVDSVALASKSNGEVSFSGSAAVASASASAKNKMADSVTANASTQSTAPQQLEKDGAHRHVSRRESTLLNQSESQPTTGAISTQKSLTNTLDSSIRARTTVASPRPIDRSACEGHCDENSLINKQKSNAREDDHINSSEDIESPPEHSLAHPSERLESPPPLSVATALEKDCSSRVLCHINKWLPTRPSATGSQCATFRRNDFWSRSGAVKRKVTSKSAIDHVSPPDDTAFASTDGKDRSLAGRGNSASTAVEKNVLIAAMPATLENEVEERACDSLKMPFPASNSVRAKNGLRMVTKDCAILKGKVAQCGTASDGSIQDRHCDRANSAPLNSPDVDSASPSELPLFPPRPSIDRDSTNFLVAGIVGNSVTKRQSLISEVQGDRPRCIAAAKSSVEVGSSDRLLERNMGGVAEWMTNEKEIEQPIIVSTAAKPIRVGADGDARSPSLRSETSPARDPSQRIKDEEGEESPLLTMPHFSYTSASGTLNNSPVSPSDGARPSPTSLRLSSGRKRRRLDSCGRETPSQSVDLFGRVQSQYNGPGGIDTNAGGRTSQKTADEHKEGEGEEEESPLLTMPHFSNLPSIGTAGTDSTFVSSS